MHLLEAYTYKIRKQKIGNSKKVIDTMGDGDWEEIESN